MLELDLESPRSGFFSRGSIPSIRLSFQASRGRSGTCPGSQRSRGVPVLGVTEQTYGRWSAKVSNDRPQDGQVHCGLKGLEQREHRLRRAVADLTTWTIRFLQEVTTRGRAAARLPERVAGSGAANMSVRRWVSRNAGLVECSANARSTQATMRIDSQPDVLPFHLTRAIVIHYADIGLVWKAMAIPWSGLANGEPELYPGQP